MIDEFTDVNRGEKELMKLWNRFAMQNKYAIRQSLATTCRLSTFTSALCTWIKVLRHVLISLNFRQADSVQADPDRLSHICEGEKGRVDRERHRSKLHDTLDHPV